MSIIAIPALIGNLKEHGNFSGKQINQSNSEAIMLIGRWPMELAGTFDFRWSNNGFRNLGIIIYL